MRLIYWSLAAPLMLLAVLFAISNMQTVTLGLWPLPFNVDAPIFLVALGGLALGFIAGGAVAWLGAGRARSRARVAERALRKRESEIEDLRRRVGDAERAAATKSVRSPPSGLPAPAMPPAAMQR